MFLTTFKDISDYAILYLQLLWLVGTSGKNSQIPFMGDLAKNTAVVNRTLAQNLRAHSFWPDYKSAESNFLTLFFYVVPSSEETSF